MSDPMSKDEHSPAAGSSPSATSPSWLGREGGSMRLAKLGVVLLLAVIVVAAWPSGAQAAGRVALVVGNSAYAHIGELPNPGNDAADVGAALRRLGFEVTVARDADRAALNDALRAFTRRSAGADVALVFYAGHGMEMDGVDAGVDPAKRRGGMPCEQ